MEILLIIWAVIPVATLALLIAYSIRLRNLEKTVKALADEQGIHVEWMQEATKHILAFGEAK